MYHWDTLMVGHFAIDTDAWQVDGDGKASDVMASGGLKTSVDVLVDRSRVGGQKVRILHAPNHRALKGTSHFETAVAQLRTEGLEVELDIVEGQPNDEVRRRIARADIVADQLVVGWYAMFSIEAMSQSKPVVCYLRPDLCDLFIHAGVLKYDELPIVNATADDVVDKLRSLILDARLRQEIGARSRQYIEKHHSVEAIGRAFAAINRKTGVLPDLRDAAFDAPTRRLVG
jgi:glycosyltransferase involved in cell wall biosynthesis